MEKERDHRAFRTEMVDDGVDLKCRRFGYLQHYADDRIRGKDADL